MKCFKCQNKTVKQGEVYYRFNKLDETSSPTGFDGFTNENTRNTFCCENCWDNHKEQILEEDDNIIQVSKEQDNLHQIVYTQAKCSQCNQYKKALCQCNSRESVNLGEDYTSLQPTQQEGRQKTQNSWTNKKNISFLCFHCQKAFPYDKNIISYGEARNKAKNELNAHKNSCSYDNNTNEGKLKAQNWWNETRDSKTRIIKTCEKCWGKVLWDKSIIGADEARVQVLSDFKYHQEHECHLTPTQRTIAIYHSPNRGGNQHAPLDYSLLNTDDGIYSQDNDGEIYQNQGTQPNNFNWKPWAIGGGVILVLGIIVYYFIKKNKKES